MTAANASPIILPFKGLAPAIDPSAFVAPGAAVVGDVTIGAGASIWFGCVLRGDDNYIRIGPRSNLQDGTVVHVTIETHPTVVGADVIVGHGARLHGCVLEDGCLVGIGAVVLDGAVVERGAMVAAGALITPNRRIPAGELWAGSPAKRMRALGEADREFMRWDASHYAGLAAAYRVP